MNESGYEDALRTALGRVLRPDSHYVDHLDRVLSYALDLQQTYGGDVDVVVAAVMLHNLERGENHLLAEARLQQPLDLVRDILVSVNFPQTLIPEVLRAVAEHRRQDVHPSSIEGRILKDADFLAGFGAVGIVREAMRVAESGAGLGALLDRLESAMAERIASLEFEQSRYQAAQDYLFVRLFVDKLQGDSHMQPLPGAPYIVIEGVTSSGKTTQAEMLHTRYHQEGADPVLLQEPTAWYHEMRDSLDARQRDRQTQLLLGLTDRYINLRHQIQDAQLQGRPVISDRGAASSMVYQSESGWLSPANIAYLHTLVPQPTHLIVLDLPTEIAMERSAARAEAGETAPTERMSAELLGIHRHRYRALRDYFPHLLLIDATESEDDIHDVIWQAVEGWPKDSL